MTNENLTAEDVLEKLKQFVDENFPKNKFGFLLVVAQENEDGGTRFVDTSNMRGGMIEYHMNALGIKMVCDEPRPVPKKETIQ